MSFWAQIDLAAMLPVAPSDSDAGYLEMEATLVLPDQLRYKLTAGLEDEVLEIELIAIGEDLYVRDPLLEDWYKDSSGALGDIPFVGQVHNLYLPDGFDSTLEGVENHDDGTRSYVLSSTSTALVGGVGGFGESYVRLVDVDTFLTREMVIRVDVAGQEPLDMMRIEFYGYNEPTMVEPPEDYQEMLSPAFPAVTPTPHSP